MLSRWWVFIQEEMISQQQQQLAFGIILLTKVFFSHILSKFVEFIDFLIEMIASHSTEIIFLLLGYCREQKEFAFEIASRVVSTKRAMQ